MKFWLITVGEPTPEDGADRRLMRTGLLAQELLRRGHQVTWWSSSYDHFAKKHLVRKTTERDWVGGRLIQLHTPLAYRSNVSLTRIIHNILTAREFRKRASAAENPDVIVCSFPTIELSVEAVRVGREKGAAVVVDVRDLWPDIFADAVPGTVRPLAKFALAPLSRQARKALSGADAVIGISQGYLDWGLKYAGRAAGRKDGIFPIGYRDVGVSRDRPLQPDDLDWLKSQRIDSSQFIAWFVGSFGRSYDLKTVIRSARLLNEQGVEGLQFVISGDGESRKALEQEAAGLSTVRFTGWIDAGRIRLMQRVASVGLMAYVPGAPQGHPNKLFEYMSAGLPIVSSLGGETHELLSEKEIGISYTAGSPEDLAKTLVRLKEEPPLRSRLAQNARNVFLRDYDATKVYQDFSGHLEQLSPS